MRTDQEIINLVLSMAEQDDRVRAVVMNGSRANPNAPKDIFQDYDIALLVTEMDSFLIDKSWVDIFGERMIMQTPEFSVNMGKFGKYMEKYLPENCWQEFLSTYSGANYDEIWDAFFTACGLFRRTANEVANHFGYDYPCRDDKRVSEFLQHIRELPPDAVSF